jgi:hypothetical protein
VCAFSEGSSFIMALYVPVPPSSTINDLVCAIAHVAMHKRTVVKIVFFIVYVIKIMVAKVRNNPHIGKFLL